MAKYSLNATSSLNDKVVLDRSDPAGGGDTRIGGDVQEVRRFSLDRYSRVPTGSPQCRQYVENVYANFRSEEPSSEEDYEQEELAAWPPGAGSKVSWYCAVVIVEC